MKKIFEAFIRASLTKEDLFSLKDGDFSSFGEYVSAIQQKAGRSSDLVLFEKDAILSLFISVLALTKRKKLSLSFFSYKERTTENECHINPVDSVFFAVKVFEIWGKDKSFFKINYPQESDIMSANVGLSYPGRDEPYLFLLMKNAEILLCFSE